MSEFCLKNPWVRSLFPLLLMAVSSVVASALVVEIADGNTINWSELPKKKSFYFLLVCTLAMCVYQVLIFKHDSKLIKGITPKQFEASLRNEVAEATAKRAKQHIKNGRIDLLEQETLKFKQLFGEGGQ
ncbi:hypothetical protein RAL01_004187 [Vibrio vulnificus]|uniref:hypothetical protein n=2 Tax=Vibrio vulnificus TaxID=672 RepID=UPI0005C71201|nr:hypothetical protein [Vibrio vulnificus]EGR0102535.1 hypothetical protein [Vibrio vulnificus]EHD2237114.1 hypothetical protein [Vibrio vulnificus]EHK9068888.1 hypothetical protein [Vibrio vulnificus]EHZ2497740.1 hypothetical protein [Vibrio vulnificus]EIJ0957826.1 hypothetical protein [Vibrio vulnificus]